MYFSYFVLEKGLEPLSLAALVPKTSAYTNSATPACAPRRDRTFDLILKRDLLYQLSYGRI